MPNEVRKMAFWEIAKGTFAKEFQGDFEKAQEIATRRGCIVNIMATVTIYPEHKDTPGYGAVEFQTAVKEPPKKSMRHVTELKNGKMIKDGLTLDDIHQLDLNLPEVKQTPFVPPADRSMVMGPDGEQVDDGTGEIIN